MASDHGSSQYTAEASSHTLRITIRKSKPPKPMVQFAFNVLKFSDLVLKREQTEALRAVCMEKRDCLCTFYGIWKISDFSASSLYTRLA